MKITSGIFLVMNAIFKSGVVFMPPLINISNTFAKIILCLFGYAHNFSYLMCTKKVRPLF